MGELSPVACARCGALNELSFRNCIRCGVALAGNEAPAVAATATPAQLQAARAVARPPVKARPGGLQGTGSEPLFGRWPATDLPVAWSLVVVNLVVYALHLIMAWQQQASIGTLLTGGSQLEALRFGALPVGPENLVVAYEEPWRLLSACFVHFGIIHVGMNMMGAVYLSRICEPMVGSVRMLITYVICGVVSFAISLAWYASAGTHTLTAGASGALFGLLGMVLGVLLRQRDPRWRRWLMQGVVYSVAFTFLIPSVNHAAHLGGLAAGTLCGWVMGWGAPKPSTPLQRTLAAIMAFLCVASLVAAPFSPLLKLAVQH